MPASRPIRPNVTSSIKPKVHNVAQRRRKRTEPRPQGICTQHFVKIGPGVPEICSQTDKHTDQQTDHNTPHPYRGGVITDRNTVKLALEKHNSTFKDPILKQFTYKNCSYHCAYDYTELRYTIFTASRSVNLPCYPPDNHRSSDAVYWAGCPLHGLILMTCLLYTSPSPRD